MAEPVDPALREDVLTAARRFLGSWPRSAPSALAGPLLEYTDLYDGLAGFSADLAGETHTQHISVGYLENGIAYCDCEVVLVDDHLLRGRRTAERSVMRVSGPLVLENRDGEWKVVDYVVNGRRRLRTLRFYGPDFAVPTHPLSVEPIALELASLRTMLLVDVTNLGSAEFSIDAATTHGRAQLGPWFRRPEFASYGGETRFPAGTTRRLVAIWATTRPLLTRSLPVTLRFAETGTGRLLRAELELPFRELPEPTVPAYADLPSG
ncbi:MAG TPA: hypothetical protein VGM80_02820 [Gaiellaceae bacterium]